MADSSRVPAVIDALLAYLPPRLTPTKVVDGPGASNTEQPYLLVGVDDPDSEEASTAATSRHEAAGMGKSRDQSITVYCTAVAWTGNEDAKEARDAAYALLAAVEAEISADPTLGGVVFGARVGDDTLRQNTNNRGVEAHVLFTVEARTHLS